MAGVMVHLAVADAAADLLKIKDPDRFLTGSIAPDCIHSREGYCRDMKRHTHLKDGLYDWELLEPEKLEDYRRRLAEFSQSYCRKESEDFELYAGYYAHLVTDELFVRTVRQEFAQAAEKDGIFQTDKRFFYEIMKDINGIDSLFAKGYPYGCNIPDFLNEKGFGCGFVTEEEVAKSKRWIHENFYGNTVYDPPARISFQRMLDFTAEAAAEVAERTEDIFGVPERDERYMREALVLAKRAAAEDEVPVGAVVVRKSDGEIVGRGFNRREGDKNPLAHAEIAAVSDAARRLGGWRLIDCELYVTLEPCPMCCGAVINSRIERVVYGARDPKSGSAESVTSLFSLPYNHRPEIRGGVLEKECSEILSRFFRRLRGKR